MCVHRIFMLLPQVTLVCLCVCVQNIYVATTGDIGVCAQNIYVATTGDMGVCVCVCVCVCAEY